MMINTIVVIIGIVGGVLFISAVLIVYREWPYFCMDSIGTSNNNRLAIDSFIGLLYEAEYKMSIFDEGNIMDESIYQDKYVIKLVNDKLKRNPDFKMECSFSSSDENKFRKTFENHPQVDIRIRQSPFSDSAHYKIIDDGKKAYLSWHNPGSQKRNVQRYDFSKVRRRPWPGQADVIQEHIGKYLEDIKLTFSQSAAIN